MLVPPSLIRGPHISKNNRLTALPDNINLSGIQYVYSLLRHLDTILFLFMTSVRLKTSNSEER